MIAVVGAGPAGLAAAWRAALAGHEVTVIERTPAVGGMAGSFEVAGVRVDHGSHRLHPATPPHVLAELRGLLGDDLQTRLRNGRIRLLDRWVAFPLRPGDLLRRAPRPFALRAAADALAGPLRRPRRDTFAEVIRAGLGPAVLDAFYAPYARKLWGVDPSDLAGELARRRVSAASPLAIARRLLRTAPGRGRGPAGPGGTGDGAARQGQVFLYPRRGFGAIAEALAAAAADAGATIRLGTGVTGLRRTAGGGQPDGSDRGWQLALSDGTTLDAAHVWSTAPLPALAGAMDPAPPPAVTEATAGLRHRAMVLLYLVLDRPRWTPFDAHYFPGPEVLASRLSEPRNYRDDPHEPDDRTVLCAEIPCDAGDPVWEADDADLAGRLATELGRMGLPEPDPVEVTSRRLPRVYPIYRPGFAEDLRAVEEWATGQPGLLSFGRQGLFTPDNTHHALAMGWAAAAALGRDGRFDEAGWRVARDDFRTFVVED